MSANDRQPGGNHYKKDGNKIQHWDLMALYKIGYLEGCASKYGFRFLDKAGDLDLQKADHFVEKMIDMTAQGYKPSGFVPHHVLKDFCDEQNLSDEQTDLMFLLLSEWSPESLEAARHVIAELRVKHYPTN